MDDQIVLIATGYETNEIGERVQVESRTTVWAHVKSVTRAEWMEAGRLGLNPATAFETPKVNYSGEKILEFRGKRYAIYRTYSRDDLDIVELYAELQAGVV